MGFQPLNGQQCQQNLQKAHPCIILHRFSHQAWESVWPVDKFKKRGINKHLLCFTHFHRSSPETDLHQIWQRCRGHPHNYVWQIFWQWVKGCQFCRELKFALSHRQDQLLQTQDWCFRAAHDTTCTQICQLWWTRNAWQRRPPSWLLQGRNFNSRQRGWAGFNVPLNTL